MKETKISILIDENYNITLTNTNTKKEYSIDYSKKEINASGIYDLLDYSPESKYIIESNIDSMDDGNEKDYFYEIIEIMNSIINELNNLNGENGEPTKEDSITDEDDETYDLPDYEDTDTFENEDDLPF